MIIFDFNKTILATGLLVALIALPNNALANDWTFHVAGTASQKSLDVEAWQPVNSNGRTLKQESNFGAMFDIKNSSWPVAIALDVFFTADSQKVDGIRETAVTTEQHIGVRKYWGTAKQGWQTYFGGGLATFDGEFETKTNNAKTTQNDSDVGYWLGGGANWQLGNNVFVGLDVRYSAGSLELFQQKRELDGVMAGLTVGFSW